MRAQLYLCVQVPPERRLKEWYRRMLDVAIQRGIVESVATLYEQSFKDPRHPVTAIPYLEGDYWTTRAEELIKQGFANKVIR
jgi:hypothetical protein